MRWTSLLFVFALLLMLGLGTSWAEEAPPTIVFKGLERGSDGVWVHHFGKAAQQQELEATLAFRNPGGGPVKNLRAVGDCGCYGVTLSATEIPQGGSGTVTVRFRTLMFSGVVTKRLRLHFDGGPKGGVVLKLHLEVVSGVVIEPPRIWFGDVLVGSRPEHTVVAKWHADGGRPFRITKVEVPGYDFAIQTAPYADGKWKGTAITLAFKRPPPLGMFTGTALIRTDHPDYPRITLALTAHVTGKVWLQTRKVYLGWVPRGKSKRTSLLVRPLDKSVDLGEVSASSRKGRVAVRVEKNAAGDGGWTLIVEVPEDAEPGPLDDVIEVKTIVPGEEMTEIEVQGEVLSSGT